jgi:nitrite reductase/ring-hydroxylating ferredoxin subunit
MTDIIQEINQVLKRQVWLDPAGTSLQKFIQGLYQRGGETGRKIADFFHGTWLGHPLHPVLTDVPIGAWTVAVTLDRFDNGKGDGIGAAADAAVGIGVASAAASAVAGFTDWTHLTGESRRTGFAHALLNTAALGFFIGSLVARKKRDRGSGRLLALIGYSVAGFSAYLGGDLVFRQKVGVDHSPNDIAVKDFTPVIALAQLSENQLTLAKVEDVPLAVLRRGEKVYVLANTCSHLGGPLAEGSLSDTTEGCLTVTCPWHASRFRLADGTVLNGPATYAQPAYEVRIYEGQVEVRRRVES